MDFSAQIRERRQAKEKYDQRCEITRESCHPLFLLTSTMLYELDPPQNSHISLHLSSCSRQQVADQCRLVWFGKRDPPSLYAVLHALARQCATTSTIHPDATTKSGFRHTKQPLRCRSFQYHSTTTTVPRTGTFASVVHRTRAIFLTPEFNFAEACPCVVRQQSHGHA